MITLDSLFDMGITRLTFQLVGTLMMRDRIKIGYKSAPQ